MAIFASYLRPVKLLAKQSFLVAQLGQRGNTFILAILLPMFIGLKQYGRFSILWLAAMSVAGPLGETASLTLIRYLSSRRKSQPSRSVIVTPSDLSLVFGLVAGAFLLAFSFAWALTSSEFAVDLRTIDSITCGLLAAAVVLNSSVLGISTGAELAPWMGTISMAGQLGSCSVSLLAASLGWSGELTFLATTIALLIPALVLAVVCGKQISQLNSKMTNNVGQLGYDNNSELPASRWRFVSLMLAGMFLGAPVHLFCLSFLKNTPEGISSIGAFNSICIWFTLISIIPGLISFKIVAWFTVCASGGKIRSISSLFTHLIAIPTTTIGAMATILGVCALNCPAYMAHLPHAQASVTLALVSGVIAANGYVIVYWLYAVGRADYVFKCNVVYAVVYVTFVASLSTLSNLNVTTMFLAIALAQLSQCVCLFAYASKTKSA